MKKKKRKEKEEAKIELKLCESPNERKCTHRRMERGKQFSWRSGINENANIGDKRTKTLNGRQHQLRFQLAPIRHFFFIFPFLSISSFFSLRKYTRARTFLDTRIHLLIREEERSIDGKIIKVIKIKNYYSGSLSLRGGYEITKPRNLRSTRVTGLPIVR